jgi:hypothetical protein
MPREPADAMATARTHCTLAAFANGTITHSISSSATARSSSGMVRPSAFAALRLMTSSNLVGRKMGDQQISVAFFPAADVDMARPDTSGFNCRQPSKMSLQPR